MARIVEVEAKSPAARAGFRPEDELVEVDGHPISDVFDYRFYTLERTLLCVVRRGDKTLRLKVKKKEYQDMGLVFDSPLMDEKRRCSNGCIFCFIDQLPRGMRESLYFKDDDTRLSFLHGNYVTMTNLTRHDVDRITEMHMSPVNVSIHTTDPDLRVQMMRNKRAGEVLAYLDDFARAGLTIRAQIVLCRGINDGDRLLRSLTDLARYYPNLDSVSVVFLWFGDHREGLYPLDAFTKEDAEGVIALVDCFGEAHLKEHGSRLVFCADEWYLKAEKPLPSESYYEGYPQLDNGVGMLRSLIEEAAYALEDMPGGQISRHVSVATGVAAAPTLRMLADRLCERVEGLTVDVYPVVNHFFGERITVAGLLTGTDIVRALSGKDLGDVLLIPQNALRADEDVLLDDVTVGELSESLGVPVVPVCDDGEAFLKALMGQIPQE